MKKIILILVLFFMTNTCSFGYDLDLTRDGVYHKKIMEMGFSILNANRIGTRATFRFQKDTDPNACAYSDKTVVIYSGLLPYIEDDSELAGILCHEIAHTIDYSAGFWRTFSMSCSPKKYEEKADKKAVDYMVKAGYDPIAMIIILNKIGNEYNNEFMASHPLTSRRLAYIYEYIYQKYPAYIADNQYKTNLYYQNFLITSKKDREQIRNKNKNLINASYRK